MASFTSILIRNGIISKEQLAHADQVANDQGIGEGDALINLGYATGEQVMRAMAEEHNLEYIDLSETPISPSVVELVPESVARENTILPLDEVGDEALRVIVSDPFDLGTFDKLRFILNKQIEIALAPREAILEAINRYYGQIEGESADSMLQEFTDTAIDFTETVDDEGDSGEAVDEMSAPVVKLVQLMINEAVQLRASDIHIEPFEDRDSRSVIELTAYWSSGIALPACLLGALLSRIKILAKMDIAERRRTQDGRIKDYSGGQGAWIFA